MLISIELFNTKLNKEKSYFSPLKIVIIEYACDYDERHLKVAKIVKIIK